MNCRYPNRDTLEDDERLGTLDLTVQPMTDPVDRIATVGANLGYWAFLTLAACEPVSRADPVPVQRSAAPASALPLVAAVGSSHPASPPSTASLLPVVSAPPAGAAVPTPQSSGLTPAPSPKIESPGCDLKIPQEGRNEPQYVNMRGYLIQKE